MKNHFTGKLLLIFTAALLVSVLSGAALADVIWEPEDDFYEAHAEQCEYMNAQVYANGESGYLEVFDKPDGSGVGFADNGQLFYASFVYVGEGEDWAIIDYSEGDGRLMPPDYNEKFYSGWVRLSDTIEKYDSAAFSADHADSIKNFEGDASSLLDEESIAAWTYPNSGELQETIEKDWVDEDFADAFSVSYTDEDGREWIFCGYYRAHRNFWVCLSDPANTELPPLNTPNPQFIQPQSDELPELTGGSITTTIIICVCAVVLISAVLIVIIGRKRKSAA